MATRALISRWDNVLGWRMHGWVPVEQDGNASDPLAPLVLVHGLSVSSKYLLPTADFLQNYRPVYVPDFPGFGESEKPSKALNIAELAEVLADWMSVVGVEQATLVGNSLGCQIIVEFALRYPKRTLNTVLVNPTPDPFRRSFSANALRLALAGLREPVRMMPIIAHDYLQAGLWRTLRTSHVLLEDPIERKLPYVQAPTLIVRGERDPIVSQRWAEVATSLLPHGQLVILPRAAHTPNYSYPRELAQVVTYFLDGKVNPQCLEYAKNHP